MKEIVRVLGYDRLIGQGSEVFSALPRIRGNALSPGDWRAV